MCKSGQFLVVLMALILGKIDFCITFVEIEFFISIWVFFTYFDYYLQIIAVLLSIPSNVKRASVSCKFEFYYLDGLSIDYLYWCQCCDRQFLHLRIVRKFKSNKIWTILLRKAHLSLPGHSGVLPVRRWQRSRCRCQWVSTFYSEVARAYLLSRAFQFLQVRGWYSVNKKKFKSILNFLDDSHLICLSIQ